MENMHTDVKAQRVNDAQNENLWISNRLFSIVPEKKLSKSHLTKKTILRRCVWRKESLGPQLSSLSHFFEEQLEL